MLTKTTAIAALSLISPLAIGATYYSEDDRNCDPDEGLVDSSCLDTFKCMEEMAKARTDELRRFVTGNYFPIPGLR